MAANERKETPKETHAVDGDDASYVGRRISKKFGRKNYHGTVDEYDAKDRLWHVTYDDGDEEELDHEELVFAMDKFDRIHKATPPKRTVTKQTNDTPIKLDPQTKDAQKSVEDDKAPSPKMRKGPEKEDVQKAKATVVKDAVIKSDPPKRTDPQRTKDTGTKMDQQTKLDIGAKIDPQAEGNAALISAEDQPPSPKKKKGLTEVNSIPSKTINCKMSFTTPIVVAIIAIVIWLCKTAMAGSNQEDFLRSTSLLKFQPDKYQGARKNKRYFEGWYYKLVTPLLDDDHSSENASASPMSMAVVPGIFYGNASQSQESHAFVFVTLNGERQHYYRFPTSEFAYASPKEEYYIQVGNNRFTHEGVTLDLRPGGNDDADLVLRGELTFVNPNPWPVSMVRLGAMGPIGWLPWLECVHGVLSFDHILRGSLTMTSRVNKGSNEEENEEAPPSSSTTTISFDDGRGYTEKDYGKSFPSLWVWIQSNSFRRNPGTSLFVSIARVPLFRLGLPGFTAAVWHNGTLIPFATWSGAKFEDLRISKDEVYVAMRSSRWSKSAGYRVEITVDRRNVPEVLLYAPVHFTKMAPFVWEALQANVHMRLSNSRGDVIVDDVGEYAGLEVHGNAQWLVDNVCGKKSANKFICL